MIMKKAFKVEVDITYSVSVYIEAENESEAKAMAEDRVGRDPRYWTQSGAIANINAYDVFDAEITPSF
jgi:hypothetical protein